MNNQNDLKENYEAIAFIDGTNRKKMTLNELVNKLQQKEKIQSEEEQDER